MMLTIVCAGLILCLIYGIKETMEKWDGEDE
jgi:hypothetical protein